MNILIESMTKFVHEIEALKHLTIRCWRQEEKYDGVAHSATIKEIQTILDSKKLLNPREIAEELIKIDRMNAVEVLDATGMGIVLYADWP